MGKDKAEALIVGRINEAISKHDPIAKLETNPKLHIGLNSQYIAMRHELYALQHINTKARKMEMRKCLAEEFLKDEQELAKVGLAFINTHV